jgi:amino acid adenylation domain-containing protein
VKLAGTKSHLNFSGERRELFERGRAKAAPTSAQRDPLNSPIGPRPRDGPMPLSYAQERLWLLHELDPGHALFSLPVIWRLRAAVDIECLERCLDEILRRHEVLRTRFVTVNGHPCQEVVATARCPLRVVDLRSLPADEREARSHELGLREQALAFDLAVQLPLRVLLITLDARDHVLISTFHHIAFDGWSVGIFRQELTALYTAYVRGDPSPLPDLPIQYGDYSCWQRWALELGNCPPSLIEYWKERLGGLRMAEIPPDQPRSTRSSHETGREQFILSAPVVRALRFLEQRELVTPFMVLLAGLSVLIQRYTAKDDITVGTSVAGRTHAESAPLIGCFLNTLVLRNDLSDDPTVCELLGRVRATALGAYSHQELPFELLLQLLCPERDLSRTPFFQVYLNFLNLGESYSVADEIRTGATDSAELKRSQAITGVSTHSPFELALYAQPIEEEIVLTLFYAQDLFSRSIAVQFMRDLTTLLGAMAERPDARISTLPLDATIDPSQAQNGLSKREVCESFPTELCEQSIACRFRQVANQFPARRAIVTGDAEWSYAELLRRSDHLAACLRTRLNGCSGIHIALLMGHNAVMVQAILGVLGSGNAYIPLDPRHPINRLVLIVDDAQAQFVLVDESHAEQAQAIARHLKRPLSVIQIREVEQLISQSDSPIEERFNGDAMAYILYTSGSTGTPKGIMQSQRNVLRHIRAYTNSLRITSSDGLSMFASYGFDAAVMDIFGALLNGARMILMDTQNESAAAQVEHLSGVTILHVTPTVFRHLLASINQPEVFAKVRMVVLGGEPVSWSDVALYRKSFGQNCCLVNGLGPSESTLALQYFVDSAPPAGTLVPVGFPVQDTQIRLLNCDRREVGLLAAGEIAITSEQVALGYWRNEALTRAVFIPSSENGRVRTYLSGDLGRRRRDGCVEFLGRKDDQVKIRGIRVETTEVERYLAAHLSVKDAAVVAISSDDGESFLVGFLSLRDDSLPEPEELRRFLRRFLPDAMIPARFVRLDHLPMTVHGKLDRQALKSLPVERLALLRRSSPATAPRTAIEKELMRVWREVLRMTEISRNDNFFELGGHSLMITQTALRIQATMGRTVPLRVFFESPILAEMAQKIEEYPPTSLTSDREFDFRVSRERYRLRLS